MIKRTYGVSEADDARGLKGASMWGTPVYDSATGHMFNGTGQPANKDREHSLSNAIVKVDVDRSRTSFGEIVDSYHGDWDERADVDFGGSPTLFKDAEGNTLVGVFQKSGRYHAVFADTTSKRGGSACRARRRWATRGRQRSMAARSTSPPTRGLARPRAHTRGTCSR
jgi:hypothetical protein